MAATKIWLVIHSLEPANFVKEIAKLNGKIDHFVTRSTMKSLKEKYD